MRFNDKELVKVGEQKGSLEGLLAYMKPQGKDWSDWYQQPCFKERYFKLIANLLYYYRIGEPEEPLGVLVLENAHVAFERPHKGIPFAFSITFKVSEKFRDDDTKHIFSCRCDSDVSKWVSALKQASFEYWRTQYVILKVKLGIKKGQDPVLEYTQNKCSNYSSSIQATKRTKKKKATAKFYNGSKVTEETVETTSSTFYSSASSSGVGVCNSTTIKEISTTNNNNSDTTTIEDLISF